MTSRYEKTFEFQEVKTALLNNDAPFPPTMVYFFSDISPADLILLAEIWPKVWTERRRGLLEDMEQLSEKDTLLFFDAVALLGLEDADPVARAAAIRLLWQSEEEDLVTKLLTMLNEDPESIVRAAAATALGNFVYLGELEEINQETYENILKKLVNCHLKEKDTLVRRRALESLGFSSHPDIPDYIQKAYDTDDDDWLQSALLAMGRSYDQHWTDSVLQMLDHPDSNVRYEAARAAGELESKEARESLIDMIDEGIDDENIFQAAIWSLTKIGGSGIRVMIENFLEETDDLDEIQFLEEALENLNFTEQVSLFDMMNIDEDDDDDWDDEEW